MEESSQKSLPDDKYEIESNEEDPKRLENAKSTDFNGNMECSVSGLPTGLETLKSESTPGEKNEGEEDGKKWVKIRSFNKRNYRSHKSDEGEEDTESSVSEIKEHNIDDNENDSPDARELERSVFQNCHIKETVTDGDIDISGVKTRKSKLKRTKCKSHDKTPSSADRKKRKKAESMDSKGSMETGDENTRKEAASDEDGSDNTDTFSYSSSSSSSSSSSADEKESEEEKLTDDEEWLEKNTGVLPAPKWRAAREIRLREYGFQIPTWPFRVCGSRAMVQKFERQFTLDAHEGCVNALHFNQNGSLLASGSDDRDVHIWDWAAPSEKPFISYPSGHHSNVFQAKFMPDSNDATVISCARDGQVRVGYLSSTGSCRDTTKLAQHRGSAHKLAIDRGGSRFTFLSCGEDAVVMNFDLRDCKPSRKILTVKEEREKVALYSIDTNPLRPTEFAVSGRDQFARVYDLRMLSPETTKPTTKYCPHHLEAPSGRMKSNITCLVYNYNGSELLCSYNDEDIYLFNTAHSTGAYFTHTYKGHRNNATVKGVNFYGPRSEFIVSGSDCGNIFLWEKESSQVVQFMEGDEGGVVNVLEPHPNLPLLATSGLDKNIKIWGPTGDGTMKRNELNELMLSNRQKRHEEQINQPGIDGHLIWLLMRSLRNSRYRKANV